MLRRIKQDIRKYEIDIEDKRLAIKEVQKYNNELKEELKKYLTELDFTEAERKKQINLYQEQIDLNEQKIQKIRNSKAYLTKKLKALKKQEKIIKNSKALH